MHARAPLVLLTATLLALALACSDGGGSINSNGTDASTLDVSIDAVDSAGSDSIPGEDVPPPGDTTPPEDTEPGDAPDPGDTVGPHGCCETDAACGPGLQCIGLSLDPLGVCVPTPEADACYESRDCAEDEACQGAHVTICVMSSLPAAGTCVPMPDHCCYDDGDCEDGRECQGANEATWGPGECLLPPDPGSCYRDEHCPEAFSCLGAQPCGCLVDCYWAGPGYCTVTGSSCCFFDYDCAEGLHCVEGDLGGAPGFCKPQPDDGTCWGSVDCADGQTCEGAMMCPCDADCDMEDQPGTCTPPQSDCCLSDEECPAGMTCVFLDDPLGFQGGACKPAQPEGMCWMHEDCAETELCVGANPCPCDWDGEGCDLPGDCVDKEAFACCVTHDDCQKGMMCGPVNTCVDIPAFGQCFSDADCYETQTCTGAMVCPCNALCTMPTTPGECTPLPQGCCYTDEDCGGETVCRGQFPDYDHTPGSCVADPQGPQCLGDVACCWSDEDCGAGGTCQGAYMCSCIELCYSCGACADFQMGSCGAGPGLPCCFIDAHCPEGQICAGGGFGGYPGSCVNQNMGDGCWRNDDCIPGEVCLGEQICPCDALCDAPDEPGACHTPGDGDCCFGPDDCLQGYACATPNNAGGFGVCKPNPDGVGCWIDEHCGPDQSCVGVIICPCDADCAVGDSPGMCEGP